MDAIVLAKKQIDSARSFLHQNVSSLSSEISKVIKSDKASHVTSLAVQAQQAKAENDWRKLCGIMYGLSLRGLRCYKDPPV